MISNSTRVIVCEKTGAWAAALRRVLADEKRRLCETRSLPGCWRQLQDNPGSFVAVEVTHANLDRVPIWLSDFSRRFPAAMAVAVASRGLEDYQPLLREAGAACVLFSPRRLALVARLAKRHLATAPPPMTFHGEIWERLPWK